MTKNCHFGSTLDFQQCLSSPSNVQLSVRPETLVNVRMEGVKDDILVCAIKTINTNLLKIRPSDEEAVTS